jgi:1,2-diacylglycerol 3-beta-glucosyltransferase
MALLASMLAIVALLLLAAGGAMVGTLWVFALAAWMRRERPPRDEPGGQTSFAVVIPAHDEEAGIGRTLESCRALDYPPGRHTVFVVADNCADRTAQVAREQGAVCIERRDPLKVGKGHALSFAFDRIDLERHEAVLVLDADCLIDRHALRSLDRQLRRGSRALQMNNRGSNPDESATSYLLAVGNTIENDLYYAPKSALGGVVLLRGTGMVFHRDLLRRFPWRAHSAAEDIEYTLTLCRHGQRVRFVSDAAVRSAFPVGGSQLRVQRSRWAEGSLGLARRQAWRLIGEGLGRGRLELIDAGWTLMTLSRPLVALVALAGLVLALAAARIAPHRPAPIAWWIAACPLALLAAYFCAGVVRLGVTRRRMGLLLASPIDAARLLFIALVGLVRRREGAWTRTPRDE